MGMLTSMDRLFNKNIEYAELPRSTSRFIKLVEDSEHHFKIRTGGLRSPLIIKFKYEFDPRGSFVVQLNALPNFSGAVDLQAQAPQVLHYHGLDLDLVGKFPRKTSSWLFLKITNGNFINECAIETSFPRQNSFDRIKEKTADTDPINRRLSPFQVRVDKRIEILM